MWVLLLSLGLRKTHMHLQTIRCMFQQQSADASKIQPYGDYSLAHGHWARKRGGRLPKPGMWQPP